MHDLRWERWLDDLAHEYFVASYRPELPAGERMRAAHHCHDSLDRLRQLGPAAVTYLLEEVSAPDTQRRNAAARAVSALGDPEHLRHLVDCFIEPGRQWLSTAHLVRAARRAPLHPGLASRIADLPLRVQPALVQALVAHDTAEARLLYRRLLLGPDPTLAEAAVEAVARWGKPELLWEILFRVDGTDEHPVALVPAAIQAALHLAASGDGRALDWLEERTMDHRIDMAGLAHAALGMLGWPACLMELADHLEESDGAALGYGLQAADLLASVALVPSLCEVVRRFAERAGSGLDDNPSDQAIRVLERITGRWVSPELCSYDRHGNYDASTRRRAALLYTSVAGELDATLRYRDGEPLSEAHLVHELLSSSPQRVRAAALQLISRTGVDHGFDPRDDLVGNLEPLRAWQAQVDREPRLPAGQFGWRARVVSSPM